MLDLQKAFSQIITRSIIEIWKSKVQIIRSQGMGSKYEKDYSEKKEIQKEY